MSDNLCVKPTFSIVEITKTGATISTRFLKKSNIYALHAVALGHGYDDRDCRYERHQDVEQQRRGGRESNSAILS
jgi:hypothetical protein